MRHLLAHFITAVCFEWDDIIGLWNDNLFSQFSSERVSGKLMLVLRLAQEYCSHRGISGGPYCLSSASNYKRHQSKRECSAWDHVHRSMSHAWPIIVARRWGNTGQTSESEAFQHRILQLRWILFFPGFFPIFRSLLIGRKRPGGKGCNYLQGSSSSLWVPYLNSCKNSLCKSHRYSCARLKEIFF